MTDEDFSRFIANTNALAEECGFGNNYLGRMFYSDENDVLVPRESGWALFSPVYVKITEVGEDYLTIELTEYGSVLLDYTML